LTILLTPPIALIVSVVGWIRGGHRAAAITGVVISALIILVFFVGLPLLCR
jgi:hypothetical protein